MMTKTKSPQRAFFKKMALIPVVIAAICIFSLKTTAGILPETTGESIIETIAEPQMVYPGKGISESEQNEYNQIVNKYIDIEKRDTVVEKGTKNLKIKSTWRDTRLMPKEEKDRLYVLYIQMTEEQRKQQYIFFMGPFTPFLLRYPNVDEWRFTRTAEELWLDGEKVDKSVLASFNRKNIVHFTYTKIWGKGFGSAFFWTKKGYDAYLEKYGKQISKEKLLEIEPILWQGNLE